MPTEHIPEPVCVSIPVRELQEAFACVQQRARTIAGAFALEHLEKQRGQPAEAEQARENAWRFMGEADGVSVLREELVRRLPYLDSVLPKGGSHG